MKHLPLRNIRKKDMPTCRQGSLTSLHRKLSPRHINPTTVQAFIRAKKRESAEALTGIRAFLVHLPAKDLKQNYDYGKESTINDP